MPRFFRRLAEGVFDFEGLKRRTEELGRFIEGARREYALKENKLVAVGYSDGANIAATLREPQHLSGAVLFRAMVPSTPESIPDPRGESIFLGAGDRDPIVPAANTRRLASMFEAGGAEVFFGWHTGGHELGQDDLDAARLWIARQSFLTRHQTVRR
jgi:predicted esterase